MAKTNFKSKVCENFALELLEFIKTIFFVALSYHFWDSHLRTYRLAHTKISIHFKMKTFFFFFTQLFSKTPTLQILEVILINYSFIIHIITFF